MRLLIIATGISIGCTSTHALQRPMPAAELAAIDAEARGNIVEARMGAASAQPVGGLHAEGGRLQWTSPEPGDSSQEDLREISVIHRGKGLWQGVASGAGSGFLLGMITGIVWNTSCSAGPLMDNEYPQSSCPMTTGPSFSGGLQLGAILGGLMAIPGGIIGGVAGYSRGARSTYLVNSQ